MAELTLTDEERASPSYLDWDDASLGRAIRAGVLELRRIRQEAFDENQALRGLTAVVFLIGEMVGFNSETYTQTVEGLALSGESLGDFRLTLERLDMPEPAVDADEERITSFTLSASSTD